ncbi:PadR family transcriptional regulator [filamentous cyanobacterium LEGE 11480]|uniref:PadR family transcriptional regulator n=1 Tax=Romeriopsis navalis LEGE 11480 TaxID=2777977 RepID=A0A928Z0U2_9CYAN|nr:PadR family transcriptional regulator [Romeriopsis navalis]MBE9028636.1 PadR family transcriptional regulator [Romeriopsis navalis LEGE 11480]
MALTHTILAALSVEPHSGYDLLKRFADDNGCFWRATQQQIYRELGKLESQGAITPQVIPQEGRPDKKLYSITDAGQLVLKEWLSEPSRPTPVREELLVKVMAGHLVEPAMTLQELQRRRQMHQGQLEVYLELQVQRCEGFEHLPFAAQCQCMTLRRGIRYERSWVEWCDEAIDWLSGRSPHG